MTRTRLPIRCLAAAAAAGLTLVSTPVFAQEAGDAGASPRKAWSDAEVLPLAETLLSAITALRSSWRKEPVRREPTQLKQRSAKRMDETIKALETSARQLVSRIKSGGGYDGTVNIARKIGTLLNDAEEIGRRLDIGAWTQEKAGPAMEAVNALAPYYGSQPLYDVEQRKKIN